MEMSDLKQEIEEVINQRDLDRLLFETEKSFSTAFDPDFDEDLDFE
jgi:hypothetical protein